MRMAPARSCGWEARTAPRPSSLARFERARCRRSHRCYPPGVALSRSWFSCTYGEDLHKLVCPVAPQKPRPLAKLLAAAEAAVHEPPPPPPSAGGASAKHARRRGAQQRHDARTLELLRALEAKGAEADNQSMCVVS